MARPKAIQVCDRIAVIRIRHIMECFLAYHGKSSETVLGARLSDEKQINADISKLC
jgi:hypothetical protein